MDKRSRIWIIVLALLLAAALVLSVVFKLRLDDMSDRYDAADARRIEAEQKLAETATPTDEPVDAATDTPADEPADAAETADEPRDSDIEVMRAELEDIQARNDELQAENDSLKAELAAYSDTAAEPEYAVDTDALQAELDAARADVDTLTGRAEAAEAELAAMISAAEISEAELAAANERAEAAETALEAMTKRAENAETELAKANAELTAYRAGADMADGEKHFSAAAEDTVYVSADGVSAEYAVKNDTASGNGIVFELSLDGEVIYTSEKLAPGMQLEGFTLADALKPGSYEGAVSIKTLNAGGDVVSVISSAVTIEVAR